MATTTFVVDALFDQRVQLTITHADSDEADVTVMPAGDAERLALLLLDRAARSKATTEVPS